MKRKIILAVGLVMIVCCAVFGDKFLPFAVMDKSINIKDTVINQDIVLINHYTNWAWGYQSYGSFIDKDGNLYEFDFSDLPCDISAQEEIGKMLEIRENEKPVGNFCNEKKLKYLYELLYKVDENAGFDEENVSCDAGQDTLYGVRYEEDGSSVLVKIYSDGDWIENPKDKNAQKLCKYYTGIVAENMLKNSKR